MYNKWNKSQKIYKLSSFLLIYQHAKDKMYTFFRTVINKLNKKENNRVLKQTVMDATWVKLAPHLQRVLH